MCIALLIKTDVAETSILQSPLAWQKAFSVGFALVTSFFFFPVHLLLPLQPFCSLCFPLQEWNPFRCLKHIKPFSSLLEHSVILFLTSQESAAQHVPSGRAQRKWWWRNISPTKPFWCLNTDKGELNRQWREPRSTVNFSALPKARKSFMVSVWLCLDRRDPISFVWDGWDEWLCPTKSNFEPDFFLQ